MDPSSVAVLDAHVGSARLAPYLTRYEGNRELALRLHAWNAELATAFWGPIGLLEISLRNSMHSVLGRGREANWWDYSHHVQLAPYGARVITRTLDKLASAGNYQPNPDDVVAATSMGFWVGLLDVGVARHPYMDYETALWAPRLRDAFPYRGGMGRKQIHARLNRIRVFRNRIAHHEPIYNKRPVETRDLILECLAFLHPDLAGYVEASHRIDEVLDRQQVAVSSGDCRL
jgi:hypothetical protein